ncbi:hypothetical protein [Erythrobacter sp. MTPC3]|uniref:hypothetical protein n=1 Tax=Erythrobacter sp. MTPC3 TaxID=3056564 RepID=UPI0036F1F429
MVEFIPVMLFILGWHPDRPGELDLQRPEILFASVEECMAEGSKMAAAMTAAASDKSGAQYQARCMPVPSSQEFENAWQDAIKPAE